ncbi:MAG: MATE family efflux transporter [Synergistales bacterium]|nr:MATE family efflux transporter [Synergistales bacterium]MDY6400973.1 MATE family efflux transporter [Synergistales bacterium]MDY6404887.1 MATE family efflux transporter [Synergistales bacterium]MDY6411098.1 MATE family efflux transporter [Synergistales bacterium]MDY6414874.1 MATE family efflux transporter [Synergistales bacterium]
MAKNALEARYDYMTKTPVHKLITVLAIPTIISMMVTNLYNMADTFFVGRLSTQATAAVGVVLPLMNIIQAVGFFCGHGSGNYVSRKLGAGEIKEAQEMASTGFALAFLMGGVILSFGLIKLTQFSISLGATDEIIKDTQDYMRIILIGTPFMTSQIVINNQLRFQGSAFYAMIGLVSGAILNIFLDPLFIFTFGLGVGGAALATILSQLVSFFILFYGSTKGANIRIHFKNIRLNAHYLLQIINGGSPSLARNALISISSILLNRTAGEIAGHAAIAGMSVVNRVMMFANSALIGFGQGYQPVCSYNYGAKLYGRVKEGYKFCAAYGTLFLICLAIISEFFSAEIIKFFRDDIEVILVGSVALRWQMFTMPLNATIVISNMMLQSIGKGIRATITASARSGIFFIPSILILSKFYGLFGVEIAQPVADVFAFILVIPLTFSVWREMK